MGPGMIALFSHLDFGIPEGKPKFSEHLESASVHYHELFVSSSDMAVLQGA